LFPPFNGDIRQTGLVGSSPSGASSLGSEILPLSVTPPEGD
jgi:hypothetical protein